MSSNSVQGEIALTILVTVVSGKKAVGNCLKTLCRQINFAEAEIIVPYDKWSENMGELASEFPDVRFHFIEDLGLAASADVSAHQHRLYDRRRAVGLGLARGQIIAMTEDHAEPAEDWCQQILTAHKQSYGVIGGAIENGVDKPLNWAWYYCDFGRYGRPFAEGEINYVSDVNVSYKRDALMSVQEIWREAYHETTVHWAMKANGTELFLDERLVVYQKRPRLGLIPALRERIEWGKVFAETRANKISLLRRLMFAAGTVFLPFLLIMRIFSNMRRQKRTFGQMAGGLLWAFLLLLGWSVGEFLGYLVGEPRAKAKKGLIEMPAN